MSWQEQSDSRSCVLLRLGERRFAIAAEHVAELIAPSRMIRFAHRTPQVDGVILRRGRVVPVCDIAEQLTGKRLTSRRFYLIATRRFANGSGWLSFEGDVVEVLNLEALTPGPAPAQKIPAVLSAPEASA